MDRDPYDGRHQGAPPPSGRRPDAVYRLQGGVQQQQQTTASPYDFDASSNPSTLHQYSLHDHGNPPTYPMQHQHQSVPSSIYAPTTPAYNTAPPPPPNASVRASPALASSSSSAPFSRVSATAPRPAARAATAATRDPKATTRATRQPPTSRPVSPPSGAVGSASGWSESAVEDFSSLVPAPTTKAGRAAAAAAAASRKSNSCGPCKKRKLKCDRVLPCSGCVARGDPQGCTWDDAAPLYTLRLGNDAQDLKDQVDRLQALVDNLAHGGSGSSQSGPKGASRTPPELSSSATTRTGLHSRSPSNATGYGYDPNSELEDAVDLRANDLCEALSQLAVKDVVDDFGSDGFGATSFAPGGGSASDFIAEAKDFCARFTAPLTTPVMHSLPPSANFTTSPTLDPFDQAFLPAATVVQSSRSPIATLIDLLPSFSEAATCINDFFAKVDHFHHPILAPGFYDQWSDLKASLTAAGAHGRPVEEDAVDLSFVALLFALCATQVSGLASVSVESSESEKERRGALATKWTRGAMLALTESRFVEKPSLNAIRAILLIATEGILLANGESTSTCLGLLALAVQSAFSLGLHRDPQRESLAIKFAFKEAEERRRVFWALFYLSTRTSWVYNLQYSHFNFSQIDCKLPLDCSDEELLLDERAVRATVRGRTTVHNSFPTKMSPLLAKYRIAILMKKSSDVAFGIAPVTYSTTLKLHSELESLQMSLPSDYRLDVDDVDSYPSPPEERTEIENEARIISVILAMAFVRIHRPWLVLAATDDRFKFSRTTCVRYAKHLLRITFTSPECRRPWAVHSYKVLSCAVLLAVELLQAPEQAGAEQIKSMVLQATEHCDLYAEQSMICRKGAQITRFLLLKLEGRRRSITSPRQNKRLRGSADFGDYAPVVSSGPTSRNRQPSQSPDRFHKTKSALSINRRPSMGNRSISLDEGAHSYLQQQSAASAQTPNLTPHPLSAGPYTNPSLGYDDSYNLQQQMNFFESPETQHRAEFLPVDDRYDIDQRPKVHRTRSTPQLNAPETTEQHDHEFLDFFESSRQEIKTEEGGFDPWQQLDDGTRGW